MFVVTVSFSHFLVYRGQDTTRPRRVVLSFSFFFFPPDISKLPCKIPDEKTSYGYFENRLKVTMLVIRSAESRTQMTPQRVSRACISEFP